MSDSPYSDSPKNEANFKDKIDMNFIFNDHVRRVLQSIGTPMFNESVEALSLILPTSAYLAIIGRRNEWNPIVEDFEYEYAGPIKLGRKSDPLMRIDPKSKHYEKQYPIPYIKDENGNDIEDKDGNKKIDWTSPRIRSPRLVEVEVPDYMYFIRIILEEAENVNLSWNQDNTTKISKTNPYNPNKNRSRRKTQ